MAPVRIGWVGGEYRQAQENERLMVCKVQVLESGRRSASLRLRSTCGVARVDSTSRSDFELRNGLTLVPVVLEKCSEPADTIWAEVKLRVGEDREDRFEQMIVLGGKTDLETAVRSQRTTLEVSRRLGQLYRYGSRFLVPIDNELDGSPLVRGEQSARGVLRISNRQFSQLGTSPSGTGAAWFALVDADGTVMEIRSNGETSKGADADRMRAVSNLRGTPTKVLGRTRRDWVPITVADDPSR